MAGRARRAGRLFSGIGRGPGFREPSKGFGPERFSFMFLFFASAFFLLCFTFNLLS